MGRSFGMFILSVQTLFYGDVHGNLQEGRLEGAENLF